jgi:iron-sulfur cluster assembly protein
MMQLTDNASGIIRRMLDKQNIPQGGLRVGVKAGGCSGFSYVFGWEAEPRPDDAVFEGTEGARIFVDKRSLTLLDGTTLDYDTSLLSKGFLFINPNAKSTCGCGVSFST